jgi:hypothetical protein
MKWLWLIAAIVIASLILTCNIKYTKDWISRQPVEQDQIQTAMDLLQSNPTAAGKKK